MANDMIERLREVPLYDLNDQMSHLPDEAADAIEALQAENVRLREDRDFWKETAIVETQSRVNEAARCGFFRDILVGASASLAAAISLLERSGKSAKKAAPSDKMFDQMIDDYRSSLEHTRAALQQDKEG